MSAYEALTETRALLTQARKLLLDLNDPVTDATLTKVLLARAECQQAIDRLPPSPQAARR